MKKFIFSMVALLSFTAIFANESGSGSGCRQWHVIIFGIHILTHSNDACQNSDGNWDWGSNGMR